MYSIFTYIKYNSEYITYLTVWAGPDCGGYKGRGSKCPSYFKNQQGKPSFGWRCNNGFLGFTSYCCPQGVPGK